jgi:hypothetical protein
MLHHIRQVLLDFVPGEWRGQQDAGVALAIIEINSNNKLLLPEILHVGKMSAATIRKRVARPVRAYTSARNAIRVSKSKQQPSLMCTVCGRASHRVAALARNHHNLLHQLPGTPPRSLQPHPIHTLRESLTSHNIQPTANISIPLAARGPEQIPLRQQSG